MKIAVTADHENIGMSPNENKRDIGASKRPPSPEAARYIDDLEPQPSRPESRGVNHPNGIIDVSSAAGVTSDGNTRRRRQRRRRRQKDGVSSGDGKTDGSDEASDTGKKAKLKLLLEFIPYFGQGDTTGDNMVRSILSAAEPEELAGDRDEYDNTLLILACQYRCKGLVPLILARGDGVIDVNAVNSAGACGLHFTCYKDSICPETAVLLLERGAKPEVVENTYGCTPLHYAAGAGDVALCKRLVEAGAKASTWDSYQYTAVDYAKQSGAMDCVAYLEEVSAPGAAATGQATVKISAGGVSRGGLVTSAGIPDSEMSKFIREDTFDSLNEELGPVGPLAGFTVHGGSSPDDSLGGGGLLRRPPNCPSDNSSVGGEEGEGYWEKQCDPGSGMIYFLNGKSGESMWEKDLLAQAQMLGESLLEETPSPQLRGWLRQQTQRARLIVYLGRNDPIKLTQVDSALKRRLGDEEAFFAELVKRYGVEEDPIVAGLIKDVTRGFRGREPVGEAAIKATPSSSDPSTTSAAKTTIAAKNSSDASKVDSRSQLLLAAAAEGRPVGGGGRPPTAPAHGPGRRTGTLTASSKRASMKPSGSTKSLLSTGSVVKLAAQAASVQVSPEEIKKMQEQAQKRLDDAKTAHEELLESERQAHRDKEAEGEGAIARLEHDIKQASAEAERIRAKAEELKLLNESLGKQVQEKQANQSGEVQQLSKEAATLKTELENVTKETQTLTDLVDREQSAGAAAAESSRQDAEAKAKEESDLVHACQLSIQTAKSDAERAFREFENRSRGEEQDIQERLGKELARLEKETAAAKAKAAMDVSRAQSDAAAAKSKAEVGSATCVEVSARREKMRVELEQAALTAERNVLLQGLVTSESERRKMLHNKMEDLKGKIRVYVRVRPFSQKEKARGCTEAVEAQGKQTIMVQDPKHKDEKTFDFDQVWAGSEEAGNNQVNIFKDTGYLVTSAVDGYNVCIFAYGQTGSGKTFTMFGAGGVGGGVDASTGQCDGTAGVTPRAVLELFRVLKEREGQYEYSVKVSMFELYRDGLRDLLAKKGSNTKLVIKLAEHSGTGLVVVEGGAEKNANDITSLINTIQLGAEGRTVSSTQMNADSSRSHLLCSIVVSSTNRRTGSCLRGKLTLVDLAGSERVGKSGASGDQLKEAQSINKSLSALGDVIGALTTGVKHIPYRNHALTMMMSDSLGGNSKTLMFVCASPADYNASETINALQFAARCKSVTNSTGAGGGAAAAAQVQALRRELLKLKGDGGGKGPANTPTQLARPS